MKKVSFLILCFLLLISCNKLIFSGQTFLTAKGRLIDAQGNPVPKIQIALYNTIYNNKAFQTPLFVDSKDAISNFTQSDVDGRFQITFPSSNGGYFLMLPTTYRLDSIAPTINDSISCRFYYLDSSLFNNYLINVKDIKIQKQ